MIFKVGSSKFKHSYKVLDYILQDLVFLSSIFFFKLLNILTHILSGLTRDIPWTLDILWKEQNIFVWFA